ncbi:NAD(P)/FAD-dependent oxidoreductase [Microbacterium marinilacus]|uniref:FAD-binding oxidoreductase n=1 Tax=Microbacterium marinilacus TaxID=415209 RepID=A0ABP7B6L6_9MICO|nr:FAD-binding oxidoreductase [Microbacterium marinilacus]MBY0689953.1 FAD-binding oxidoreductase [Microbacterium marinilacus]
MPESAAKKVVVVGGGILGASTAAHLARAGATVTLVTAGALADGASGRSIAWLNSSGDRSREYHHLRLMGIDRYRTWASQHPDGRAYLRFDGAVKWAAPGETLRDTFAFERAAGYDAVWVDRSDIARVAPHVNPEAVADEGAIFNAGEGWVDLPAIVAALAEQARRAGARVLEHAGETHVATEHGRVTGVILGNGDILGADSVVLATGPAAPAELARLGVNVPNSSPAAFVLFTEPTDVPIRTVLNTPRVAVRPAADGGLVLDADWAEQTVVVAGDRTFSVPETSVEGLLQEASRVLLGSPELKVARIGAGWKPIPGDGNPVAGAVPQVPGLYVLFTHSGATLGLILGELLTEEILTGGVPPALRTFRADRFTSSQLSTPVPTGAWAAVRQD